MKRTRTEVYGDEDDNRRKHITKNIEEEEKNIKEDQYTCIVTVQVHYSSFSLSFLSLSLFPFPLLLSPLPPPSSSSSLPSLLPLPLPPLPLPAPFPFFPPFCLLLSFYLKKSVVHLAQADVQNLALACKHLFHIFSKLISTSYTFR
jgi:hypothetical protein